MTVIPRNPDVVSLLIKGPLFPRLAKWEKEKLIEVLGAEAFEIAVTQPASLSQRLPLKAHKTTFFAETARTLLPIWMDYVFLTRKGLSEPVAAKICRSMGQGCRRRLEDNPYNALSVPGVGFPDVDPFALIMGIKPQDPRRVRHGADWVLHAASQDGGHTSLPAPGLIERLSEALAIDHAQAKDTLERKIATRTWAANGDIKTGSISLVSWSRIEADIASNLRRRLEEGATHVEPRNIPARLDSTQRAAVNDATKHAIFVLTGGPGTGKTTVINTISAQLRTPDAGPLLMAAPTAKAAQRITEATGLPAQTLHTLLEYSPSDGFRRNSDRPLEASTVIVDEASMVDARMFLAILQALPARCRLILVGDPQQLASVQAGAILRDLIDSGTIPTRTLTVPHRVDTGSDILPAVHAMREKKAPPLNAEGSDFLWIDERDDFAIRRQIRRLVQDVIPNEFGIALEDIQVVTPQNKTQCGTLALNEVLQPIMNPGSLEHKPMRRRGIDYHQGDRITITQNDYQHRIFNGESGIIRNLDKTSETLSISFPDRTVTLPLSVMNHMSLGYATTVHKAQGSEYRAVIMPVSQRHARSLTPSLLYTGATRGKELVILVGQKGAFMRGLANTVAEQRHTTLRDLLGKSLPQIAPQDPASPDADGQTTMKSPELSGP